MFSKTFEAPTTRSRNDIVLLKDIEAFSYCEHHIALMYDMKISVAYIPRDRVIGLSKIVRIVDMVTRRLQLQERIGSDIAEVMEKATGSPDVAVIIEAKHSCVTARGIKNRASGTYTTTMRGVFDEEPEVRDRLLMMMR
jgi:GTP cyclohydrolase I